MKFWNWRIRPCAPFHRGGMSSEGIGDGAGVNIDLSEHFFRTVTGRDDLALGAFGVGNFFFSTAAEHCAFCTSLIEEQLANHALDLVAWRQVPVNQQALNAASNAAQQTIHQVIFVPKKSETESALSVSHQRLLD